MYANANRLIRRSSHKSSEVISYHIWMSLKIDNIETIDVQCSTPKYGSHCCGVGTIRMIVLLTLSYIWVCLKKAASQIGWFINVHHHGIWYYQCSSSCSSSFINVHHLSMSSFTILKRQLWGSDMVWQAHVATSKCLDFMDSKTVARLLAWNKMKQIKMF